MRCTNLQLVAVAVCKAALLLSVAAAAAAAATPGLSADAQAVLKQHNEFRKQHGAPPLSWSAELASGAAAQAASCAFTVDNSNPHGVNIYATSSREPAQALTAAVEFWYQQRGAYNFSAPGYQQAADSFTQVVWAATTALGCVAQACTAGIQGVEWGSQPADGTLVVCWYSPAGNVADDSATAYTQNVKPLSTPAVQAKRPGVSGNGTTATADRTSSPKAISGTAQQPKQLEPYAKVIHPASMNTVYQRLIQKINASSNNPNTTTAVSTNSTVSSSSSTGGASSSTSFRDAVDAPEIDLPASDFANPAQHLPRQLHPEDSLLSPSCLQSSNKLYKLCLHDSGNLVLYQAQGSGGQAVWSSNTAFKSAHKPFVLRLEQHSPVLVVTDATGSRVWRSRPPAGTLAAAQNSGRSHLAMLNSNGNFVVMDGDRRTVWSTKTGRAQKTKRSRQ